MMNNNKILTVSYGTFSCTLEGFEDSFDTMKAIAEYFRDLAADDRYFGAEPPQPDAEMLAKIAEREVARRVEAREHEGRIMLKAHDEAVQAPTPVVADAPAVASAVSQLAEAPVAETEAPVADEPSTEAAEQTQAFDAPYTDTPAEPVETLEEPQFADVDEPIAPSDRVLTEPLAQVEETVGYSEVADVAENADDIAHTAEDTLAADEADELLTAMAEPAMEEDDAVTPDAPTEPVVQDESVAAFFADSTVEDGNDPETEETISVEAFTGYISPAAAEETPVEPAFDAETPVLEVAPQIDAEEVDVPMPARESFADKLARIRAVVAKQDDDDAVTSYEESDGTPASEELNGSAFHEPELAEVAPAADMSFDQEVVSEAAQDIEEALQLDDAAAEEVVDEVAEEEDALDDIHSALKRFDDAEDVTPSDAETEETPEVENLFGGSDDDETSEVLGRVMKVNRADLEAAIADGDLEEYEDDALANAPALSDEEEKDLQRELAELEASDDESDTISADETVEDQEAHTSGHGTLPAIDENAEEDVSRLMAEADQQMAEPEGRTRRSAFAHLRAAVAARFADRSMESEQEKTEKVAEAYRSDLAEVVKPRRPSGNDHLSERPTDAQNAPLKLVAEQRIDVDNVIEPNVAPRRVAASLAEETLDAGDTGFAAYADEQGASSLPELLEAAASYLCYVEGQDEFSRPQLMSRVRQADCGEFSREDGLRSFGQLLRTGKIEKVKGGRFVASDAIGYKPDHRAAG